ncbi:MAG: hypothetical protein GXO83_03195 [Chlorobi bacterium]|nr:hypothetical protein [Chlorobiota bacterium]
MISEILTAQSVTLYTPYTKISVPPGQKIDYSIDVINHSGKRQNVDLLVTGIQKDWTWLLKSGSWNIRQIAILPGEKKKISLSVNVPFKVKKGNYRFNVVAKGFYSLPLNVVVSKQGTYKTEFTSNQANMEGRDNARFTFNAVLKNGTGVKQRYALRSLAPRGWEVVFKPNYKEATSVEIEPNNSVKMTIEIHPRHQVEAGTYKIPVLAETNTTSARLNLEIVITGSYRMELSTPTGLLSTHITAGDEKKVMLLLKNTGSAKLKDVKFSYAAPENWEVTFSPGKVEELDPGRSTEVLTTIKADKKAIAGDYVTKITAKAPEIYSQITYRFSVKTPMLMGWLGILIIVIALGSVYYLFQKYGRR